VACPLDVALDLQGKQREFCAEGRRFGVHTVGSTGDRDVN